MRLFRRIPIYGSSVENGRKVIKEIDHRLEPIEEKEVFELLYDRTTFEEIAEIANELFRVSHYHDDRDFSFSSTRYGESLLVVPNPRFAPNDYLKLPLSWADDWRVDIYYSFDSLLEDFLEEIDGTPLLDRFEKYVVSWWLESKVMPKLESYGFLLEERM